PPPPPRPLSQQERPFRVMIRNAMWARVDAVSRDDLTTLVRLDDGAGESRVMKRSDWDEALEAYYAEHERVLTDGDARGPDLLVIGGESAERVREVRQTLHDPQGHHDWIIEAVVDCEASDEAGQLVIATQSMRCL